MLCTADTGCKNSVGFSWYLNEPRDSAEHSLGEFHTNGRNTDKTCDEKLERSSGRICPGEGRTNTEVTVTVWRCEQIAPS